MLTRAEAAMRQYERCQAKVLPLLAEAGELDRCDNAEIARLLHAAEEELQSAVSNLSRALAKLLSMRRKADK